MLSVVRTINIGRFFIRQWVNSENLRRTGNPATIPEDARTFDLFTSELPKNRTVPSKNQEEQSKMPKSKSISKSTHIPDSQFGIIYNPEELILKIKPQKPSKIELPHGYVRPWKDPDLDDAGSTVTMDEDKFEAILDVNQFSAEELKVTIDGVHVVAVEGKHEGKQEHGVFMDRYFKRKYYVPPAYDCEKVQCKLSSDRLIVLTIPRLHPEENAEKIVVPIVQTGETLRDVVKKKLEAIEEDN